jgi:hypothetical protein
MPCSCGIVTPSLSRWGCSRSRIVLNMKFDVQLFEAEVAHSLAPSHAGEGALPIGGEVVAMNADDWGPKPIVWAKSHQ